MHAVLEHLIVEGHELLEGGLRAAGASPAATRSAELLAKAPLGVLHAAAGYYATIVTAHGPNGSELAIDRALCRGGVVLSPIEARMRGPISGITVFEGAPNPGRVGLLRPATEAERLDLTRDDGRLAGAIAVLRDTARHLGPRAGAVDGTAARLACEYLTAAAPVGGVYEAGGAEWWVTLTTANAPGVRRIDKVLCRDGEVVSAISWGLGEPADAVHLTLGAPSTRPRAILREATPERRVELLLRDGMDLLASMERSITAGGMAAPAPVRRARGLGA